MGPKGIIRDKAGACGSLLLSVLNYTLWWSFFSSLLQSGF
jgi:hypothetical protein